MQSKKEKNFDNLTEKIEEVGIQKLKSFFFGIKKKL
jgi:hypothetical protein